MKPPLTLDSKCHPYWREIVDDMKALGIWHKADRHLVEAAARAKYRYLEADSMLDSLGWEGEDMKIRQHAANLQTRMNAAFDKIGMTHAKRNLKEQEEAPDDDEKGWLEVVK